MKTALILLPGLLCDADMWAHQTEALADVADVTVADLSCHDSMKALAESVLAKAPPRFALAGLSMGGYVAFEILRRAPQRVERLALLDTKPDSDTPEQTEGRNRMIELAQSGRFEEALAGFLPKVVSDKVSQDVVDVLRSMALRMGPEGFICQQTAMMGRVDSRPDLPNIKCPTLVMAGEKDKLTPPDSMRTWATQIQGARFEVIANAGHMTPLEAPEVVSGFMREWLSAP